MKTTNYVRIERLGKLDLIASTLKELSQEEAKKHKLLGQPFGESLAHCIFLGIKYEPNFINRVKYYVRRENLPPQDYRFELISQIRAAVPSKNFIAVDFYE